MPSPTHLPTFAFLGWNPFQLRHALPVARELAGSVLVVEKRKRHLLRFRETTLDGTYAPSLVWPGGKLAELDGVFDVVVCQTPFPGLERLQRSKVAMLQYGLAKEPHNYGEWRSLADLVLTYGPYSDRRISELAPTAMVGVPAYDVHHNDAWKTQIARQWNSRLDPTRRTILYAPTWGELSTSELYIDAVAALASHYNVVLKLHHNTSLLDPRRKRLLQRPGVHELAESDDLIEALAVADVALSDYSGAIFDAAYVGKPVLLLQQQSKKRFGEKLSATSLEYARREELGRVVRSPADLREAVEEALARPELLSAELLSDLFVQGPGAAGRAAEALRQLAAGHIAPPSASQMARREAVRVKLSTSSQRRGLRLRRWHPQPSAAKASAPSGVPAFSVVPGGAAGLAPGAGRSSLLHPRPGVVLDVRGAALRAWQRLRTSPAAKYLVDGPRRALANRLFARVPGLTKPAAGYAVFLRQEGRHDDAQRALLLAQRGQVRKAALLLRIADGYRDDANPAAALPFYRAAAVISPVYGAVRLLAFESDQGLRSGRETLAGVLSTEPALLLPHVDILNRVAGLYPDAERQVCAARSALRAALYEGALVDGRTFVARVRAALAGRFLADAEVLVARGASLGYGLPSELSQRLNHIREGLGALYPVVEAAWWNEHAPDLVAWHRGELTALPRDAATTVEFFIPGAFFAHGAAEKATFETVRQVFRLCFEILGERPDVYLVPRLQLHWRAVRRRTLGFCISYHTHGEDDGRQLRIQEAPLAGRCSLDTRGYAGFSSIADGIDQARYDLPTEEEVLASQARLREELVATNTSKYPQTGVGTPPTGPYVFVPLQVRSDEVAQLAHVEMLEMLRIVVDELGGTGVAVVVKRHPYCASMTVASELRRLEAEGRIQLSTTSVHTLIEGAQAVVTVNSGVGLEALVHGKPVIAVGAADYAAAATVCKTEAELRSALRQPGSSDAARFLHYYLRYYTALGERSELESSLERWLRTGPAT